MKAGTLRHRVTFWGLGSGDAYGSGRSYDSPIGSYDYADVLPVTGREVADASLYSEVDVKLVLRYRPDIKSSMVAKRETSNGVVTYEIKAVLNEDERNRKLILLCRRVDAQ